MKHEPYNRMSTPLFIKAEKVKDRSLIIIIVCVCLLHVLAIGISFITSSPPHKTHPRPKVIVKTIKLNPHFETLASMAETAVLSPPLATVKEESFSPPPPLIKEDLPPIPLPLPETVKEIPPEPKIEKSIETLLTPIPNLDPQPQPILESPKKADAPKIETKPETKPKPKVVTPKAAPKEIKKPAAKKPAPIKQTTPEQPKQIKTPKPTPEEIAAREAERKRQQELLAAQEAARARQQELLAKAKESIAKIGETRDKIVANKGVSLEDTNLPQQLENLQIDALPVGTTIPVELSMKEISYRDEIAYRLKLALKLPDYGAVKVKLTVDRTGRVAAIQILNSESNKNKQYIEKTLPSLIFPAFGNNFANASAYTFLITLNNDY